MFFIFQKVFVSLRQVFLNINILNKKNYYGN
nr:MAG TPA: hypothetical protein [Caudoviricetes sp.]